MLFNTYSFLLFYTAVFLLYWALQNRRQQNILLLLASYVFYASWDWRFLSLIVISSAVDYLVGLNLPDAPSERRKRALLAISIAVNLGFLGFFKYFNFFIGSFAVLLEALGLQANLPSLNILLPVGISFYTFQTMSYTIDIYRGKISPTRDLLGFFAFVSFFPQLVAGPIERAASFLPQFFRDRKFKIGEAMDGLRQVLWGFFKKVVIADNCGVIADACFAVGEEQGQISYVIGVIAFAFQIYGDFSGYSDIAIGSARMLGFNLMQNFAYPYFSRDVGEFWRRWHISLSTWFRDYVYIPLGGSRGNKLTRIRNILITFTVSGLWHGASWNFVIWGFLNGAYYIPLMLTNTQGRNRGEIADGRRFPSLRELAGMAITFTVICIAWVFFRAVDLDHAIDYFRGLAGVAQGHGFSMPRKDIWIGFSAAFGILIMLGFEWFNRAKPHGLEIGELRTFWRWCIYLVLFILIVGFWGGSRSFIYFQF